MGEFAPDWSRHCTRQDGWTDRSPYLYIYTHTLSLSLSLSHTHINPTTQMDLLLTPQAHYSGGNFVSNDGAFVYYTQVRG
jgi:hypothetical protein